MIKEIYFRVDTIHQKLGVYFTTRQHRVGLSTVICGSVEAPSAHVVRYADTSSSVSSAPGTATAAERFLAYIANYQLLGIAVRRVTVPSSSASPDSRCGNFMVGNIGILHLGTTAVLSDIYDTQTRCQRSKIPHHSGFVMPHLVPGTVQLHPPHRVPDFRVHGSQQIERRHAENNVPLSRCHG